MKPTKAPTIVSLQICPGHRKQMQPIDEIEAMANLGFKGDRHALADSSRQVLLIEKETLDALDLPVGAVKENITTEGIELMKLRAHQRLKLGSDVVLEITKACSPCSRMDEVRPGLLRDLAGRRGMLARAVTGGLMRRGDSITVLENQ